MNISSMFDRKNLKDTLAINAAALFILFIISWGISYYLKPDVKENVNNDNQISNIPKSIIDESTDISTNNNDTSEAKVEKSTRNKEQSIQGVVVKEVKVTGITKSRDVLISGEEPIKIGFLLLPEIDQPLGKEVNIFLSELVNQKNLFLDSKNQGLFFRGENSIQEELIRNGLGIIQESSTEIPTKQMEKFEDAQKMAQKNKVGVWSIPGYASQKGFNTE